MQNTALDDSQTSFQATSLNIKDLKLIIQAYSACSQEQKKNAQIILALKTTWLVSGRGSEVSWIKFPRDFSYDREFGVIIRLYQPKTSEYKNVLLSASPCDT